MADVGEKFALQTVRFVQRDVRFAKLNQFQVERFVDVAQLFVAGFQIGQHRVERLGQLFKFIAGADVGADIEIALADFFGGFLEDAHGLKNQARGDDVKDARRQRAGDDSRQQDERPVQKQLVFIHLRWDIHDDDAQEFHCRGQCR